MHGARPRLTGRCLTRERMKYALALLSLCAVVSGCSDDPFFPYYLADAQTADAASDTVTLPDGTSGADVGGDTGEDTTTTDVAVEVTPRPDAGDDVACVPSCGGRECGDDGCGGRCGICSGGETCSEGVCVNSATGDCRDIVDCVNANRCADQVCIDGCLTTATPTAQARFADFFGCIEDNCFAVSDPEEFAACQQSACGDELTACVGGTSTGGTATCSEVASCLLSCDSEACATSCIADGTPAAQAQASALFNCAVDACGDFVDGEAFQGCVIEACPEQAFACFGS